MTTSPATPLRQAMNIAVTLMVISAFSVVLLPIAIVTGFKARRFYAEVIVCAMSRMLLHLARIRLDVGGERPVEGRAVFYMPNHPSIIDVFLLTALNLPNTRYFMSRSVWVYGPFAFAAWLMGVFFTPHQSNTAARVRCFQRAERRLRASGESVLGTPEGMISPAGLGRFNRGVFHLAARLRMPIVPMIIEFARGANPGRAFAPQPGTVRVHFLPEISTADWRIEDIDIHKENVRAEFARFLAKPEPSTPAPLAS